MVYKGSMQKKKPVVVALLVACLTCEGKVLGFESYHESITGVPLRGRLRLSGSVSGRLST